MTKKKSGESLKERGYDRKRSSEREMASKIMHLRGEAKGVGKEEGNKSYRHIKKE